MPPAPLGVCIPNHLCVHLRQHMAAKKHLPAINLRLFRQ